MSDNGKHGQVQLPIPNGWFAVAWGKDLVDGEVKRTRCFGEELVMFRTRSGNVRVLDAYCAHLGAHLGEGGRVIGENIRCPFHGWTYDGGGKCVEIPYCKDHAPPAAARVRAWPVVERNRMIFVWHHAEGFPPSWEVPVMPEIGDPDWTEPRFYELEVPVHMQDMAENNCDPVHFQFVHGNLQIPTQTIEYGEGGRFMRVSGIHETAMSTSSLKVRLDRDCWGLGLAAVRLVGIPDAGLLMFSSTSPVDSRNAASRWLFTVSKNLADLAGEDFIQRLSTGVLEDMRIWKNKIHRANPVLCQADTFLVEFRKWVRQFYSTPAGEIGTEA
jgi:phenylpropionate dioxygenase-like ring-hydroxylating dioxygenase large terminal subunit